jgi:beta-lactamase class A
MHQNNLNYTYFISFFILILITNNSCNQRLTDLNKLHQSIDSIIAPIDAKIGISLICIEEKDTLTVNNNEFFPMQSVYKFPLALAVMSEVEKGKFKLNQRVNIEKALSNKFSNSALLKQNPNIDKSMTIDSLIMYMIGYSDNVSSDALFDLVGGVEFTNQYMKKLGYANIYMKYNIIDMAQDPKRRYENCTKPSEMSDLLVNFYQGKILNKSNTSYLLNYMINDSTTHKRIAGDLPRNTIIAHKTGTSDTNDKGITTAVNDIGIITLPNGKHYALSVFVSDSKENYETNEKIIAKISKKIWDKMNNCN